jgi:hypothetical protein
MRTKVIELMTAVLFASIASGQAPAGQNVDRLFRFRNTQTVQGYQEIATVLRTVAGIRDFSVNIAKGTLDLHGTADQVALVGWLFNELDKPATGRPDPQQSQDSATHEFRVPGSDDDLVRVFYLAHIKTAQGLQEIVTSIRKSTGIQRIFPCDGPRAVALRGTADQIVVSERLINEADKSK